MKYKYIMAIMLGAVCLFVLHNAYADEFPTSNSSIPPYATATTMSNANQQVQQQDNLPDEATIMPPNISDMPDNSEINVNITQPYIVKSGDTLWHIASIFLKNPHRWIKVWENNAYITNPDLIYPGNEIWFDAKKQQFMVGAKHPVQSEDVAITTITAKEVVGMPNTTTVGGTMFGQSEPEKVLPLIYKRPQIEIIPVERLEPKVSSKLLVTTLAKQDYVAQSNELTGIGYLLGMQEERLYFGVGDVLYVHMQRIDVEKGTLLDVFRKGDEINDPDSLVFDYIGTLIQHLGRIRIIKQDEDHVYRAEIIQVFTEMTRGDKLKTARNADVNVELSHPQQAIQGRVLYINHKLTEGGQGQMIVIDLGNQQQLQSGTLLNITHKGKIIRDVVENNTRKLPDLVIAKVLVLNVQHRASTAFVLEAIKPIHVGDIVIGKPESKRIGRQ
ncbi:MAG: LysM peptidoglycan-binding domain-containing protein [Mariprofundales bacterium]